MLEERPRSLIPWIRRGVPHHFFFDRRCVMAFFFAYVGVWLRVEWRILPGMAVRIRYRREGQPDPPLTQTETSLCSNVREGDGIR